MLGGGTLKKNCFLPVCLISEGFLYADSSFYKWIQQCILEGYSRNTAYYGTVYIIHYKCPISIIMIRQINFTESKASDQRKPNKILDMKKGLHMS